MYISTDTHIDSHILSLSHTHPYRWKVPLPAPSPSHTHTHKAAAKEIGRREGDGQVGGKRIKAMNTHKEEITIHMHTNGHADK